MFISPRPRPSPRVSLMEATGQFNADKDDAGSGRSLKASNRQSMAYLPSTDSQSHPNLFSLRNPLVDMMKNAVDKDGTPLKKVRSTRLCESPRPASLLKSPVDMRPDNQARPHPF